MASISRFALQPNNFALLPNVPKKLISMKFMQAIQGWNSAPAVQPIDRKAVLTGFVRTNQGIEASSIHESFIGLEG